MNDAINDVFKHFPLYPIRDYVRQKAESKHGEGDETDITTSLFNCRPFLEREIESIELL